jgi:hypothetical protein
VSGADDRGFRALIEALAIFMRYANPSYPFHCEHDVLYVAVDPNLVGEDDLKRLEELGFEPCALGGGEEPDCFQSFRYGSC